MEIRTDTWPVVEIYVAPKYTPGSGPLSKPPSLLPSHDLKGVILGEINTDGHLTYTVGYEDQPTVHHGIRVLHITNYVSIYELERWTRKQDKIRDSELKAEAQAKKAARAAKKAEKTLKEQESRGEVQTSKRKSRSESDDTDFQQPKSKKQALEDMATTSASASSIQRGFSEISLELEDDDTDMLIAQQLHGMPQVQLSAMASSSGTSSGQATSGSNIKGKGKTVVNPRQLRSSAGPSSRSESSGNSVDLVDTRRSSRHSPPSVAATSSMDAASIWDNLEKQAAKKGKK
jgi:hypothetical protein